MLSRGALFTDHYQLTMAQVYFRHGLHERRSQFEYSFRSYPDYGTHQAGYAITAGLGPLLEWIDGTRFSEADLNALAAFRTSDDSPAFSPDFLEWLKERGSFEGVSIAAMLEGRVVHPNTPVAVVEAPLAMAQILETPFLNHLNFPSLIATKASRVAEAAHGGTVLEFGMRRAPGWGANAASRAALIGGSNGSSNVGLSVEVGYESRGTHAHSLVQIFMALAGGELEAFRAFAEVYPDDCVLLVDTIDTLESGVPNAIRVFEELRAGGHRPRGIRLDSGDLAHLSVRSAQLLNEAGFEDVSIVLSSQLDELTIWQIRNQIADEAPRYGVDPGHTLARLVYGVGTHMVTSHGDSSFDGVYKIVAVEDDHGDWTPAIKISDSPAKVQNPGRKGLWRVYDDRGIATADVVSLAWETLDERPLYLVHPLQPTVSRQLGGDQISEVEPLLEQVRDAGGPTKEPGGVREAADRRAADLERLDPGVRRLVNPHTYHVSVTVELNRLKMNLIEAMAGEGRA